MSGIYIPPQPNVETRLVGATWWVHVSFGGTNLAVGRKFEVFELKIGGF